jgi:hypothetical protein
MPKRASVTFGILILLSVELFCARGVLGENYYDELSSSLYSRLSKYGIKVNGDAKTALDQIVRAGADQLAHDGPSQAQLATASENVLILADKISERAHKEGSEKTLERGEIEEAFRFHICPLYPFCKK